MQEPIDLLRFIPRLKDHLQSPVQCFLFFFWRHLGQKFGCEIPRSGTERSEKGFFGT